MDVKNMRRTIIDLTPDNNGGEGVIFVIEHTADGEIVSTSFELQSYTNAASMHLDAEVLSVENLKNMIDAIVSIKNSKH